MNVLGVSTTSSTTVAVFGAASTAVLGYLGWVTAKRRAADDGAGTLVAAGVALATFESGQRHECEEELAKVKATLAEHAEKIRLCEADRELLLAMATKAGIDVRETETQADLGSLTVED